VTTVAGDDNGAAAAKNKLRKASIAGTGARQ
jgi:hypothetical protein